MGILYHGGICYAKVVWRLLADFKVEGQQHVPRQGPVLIVANHLSYFEPPMFAVIMPRRMNFMAKRDLFHLPVVRSILRAVYAFPVDRDNPDPGAIRHALDLLQHGQPLVVFPEGTRARAPGLQQGLPGVTYLALKAQVPILPVGITGTARLPGWRIFAPFRRVRVRIGPTFTLPIVQGRIPRAVLEDLTTTLMRRIAEQLPPEYQGVYRLQPGPSPVEGAPAGKDP